MDWVKGGDYFLVSRCRRFRISRSGSENMAYTAAYNPTGPSDGTQGYEPTKAVRLVTVRCSPEPGERAAALAECKAACEEYAAVVLQDAQA